MRVAAPTRCHGSRKLSILVILLHMRDGQSERGALNLESHQLSKDSLLLQTRAQPEGDRIMQDASKPKQHLPLCDPLVVEQTCRKLGGHEVTKLRWSLLAEMFSTLSMGVARSALGFSKRRRRVSCAELCTAAVQYVRGSGGILPPSSNVACRTVGHSTTCDVDVDPEELARKLGIPGDLEFPDDGPQIVPGTRNETAIGRNGTSKLHPQQISAQNHSRGGIGALVRRGVKSVMSASFKRRQAWRAHRSAGLDKHPLRYSTWQAIERIANLFCIYPSNGQSILVSTPEDEANESTLGGGVNVTQPPSWLQRSRDGDSAATLAQGIIATRQAQAKAWLATILREFAGQRTLAFRRKWFGGGGSKSEAEVRYRVLRTMNFIEEELSQGMRYVYPADQVTSTLYCKGSFIAYVWVWYGEGKGEYEWQLLLLEHPRRGAGLPFQGLQAHRVAAQCRLHCVWRQPREMGMDKSNTVRVLLRLGETMDSSLSLTHRDRPSSHASAVLRGILSLLVLADRCLPLRSCFVLRASMPTPQRHRCRIQDPFEAP
jgi:hypothetical protein